MSKNNSYPENTKKVCTKCHEEKLLDAYDNKSSGKFGKNSFCKVCRKRYDDARKTQVALPPMIIHSVTPDLLKQLRSVVQQFEENAERQTIPYTEGHTLPHAEGQALPHDPEVILQSIEHIKELTKQYIIESSATSQNSIRVNNVKETQKQLIVSKVAMNLTTIANIIVNSSDIDVVCYPKMTLPDTVGASAPANAGPSCLIVIKNVQLTMQQRQALIASLQ